MGKADDELEREFPRETSTFYQGMADILNPPSYDLTMEYCEKCGAALHPETGECPYASDHS